MGTHLFLGKLDKKMHMYGKFEGFPLNSALFGLVTYIMTYVLSLVFFRSWSCTGGLDRVFK